MSVAAQKGGAIVVKTDAYYGRIGGFRADRVVKNKQKDTYHHFLSYSPAPAVAFMQYVWLTLSVARLAFPGDVISTIVQLMPCTARELVGMAPDRRREAVAVEPAAWTEEPLPPVSPQQVARVADKTTGFMQLTDATIVAPRTGEGGAAVVMVNAHRIVCGGHGHKTKNRAHHKHPEFGSFRENALGSDETFEF